MRIPNNDIAAARARREAALASREAAANNWTLANAKNYGVAQKAYYAAEAEYEAADAAVVAAEKAANAMKSTTEAFEATNLMAAGLETVYSRGINFGPALVTAEGVTKAAQAGIFGNNLVNDLGRELGHLDLDNYTPYCDSGNYPASHTEEEYNPYGDNSQYFANTALEKSPESNSNFSSQQKAQERQRQWEIQDQLDDEEDLALERRMREAKERIRQIKWEEKQELEKQQHRKWKEPVQQRQAETPGRWEIQDRLEGLDDRTLERRMREAKEKIRQSKWEEKQDLQKQQRRNLQPPVQQRQPELQPKAPRVNDSNGSSSNRVPVSFSNIVCGLRVKDIEGKAGTIADAKLYKNSVYCIGVKWDRGGEIAGYEIRKFPGPSHQNLLYLL